LNQEIDSIEKQLTNSIHPNSQIVPSIESSAKPSKQSLDESSRDESRSIELEFLDGVKETEQMLDTWILELKAKGKS
jgi:hypothetical protein